MKIKKGTLTATYSFLLPGLGQIYQHRVPEGVVFFACFTIASGFSTLGLLAPIIMITAAWDAHRRTLRRFDNVKFKTTRREIIFAVVGAICFMAWIASVPFTWLPIGKTLRAKAEIQKLADDMRDCSHTLGHNPKSFDECGESVIMSDPWGRPYEFRKPTDEGFAILSLGNDGVEGTEDDFRLSFRW